MAHQRYAPDHDACGVGFVTRLGAAPSHEMVERALTALLRLAHRGGVDADGRSGDGAGLLMAIPDRFMREAARAAHVLLPEEYGLGMVFLPPGHLSSARTVIEKLAKRNGLNFLGWRVVPTDPTITGPRAQATLPIIRQCFFAAARNTKDFDRALFRLRKQVEAQAPQGTYFCSLSSRTVVYKGLLTPDQLPAFYLDLADPAFETSFAVFHQRYSTNTQPSWALAQPFRFVAHNGEINTISANRRWLHAKERLLKEALQLPADVRVLEERVSDSASFDNGLELLLRQNYTPAAGMLAMVPPAWETNPQITPDLRRFLEAHAPLQEPWDGPAAMVFTDGRTVGAKLDRNGLRPLRYTLTSSGLLVVGSEVGIADLHGEHVAERQRLGPGDTLVCDPVTGDLTRPTEIGSRKEFREGPPAPQLLHVVPTEKLAPFSTPDAQRVMGALGWTEDQYKLLFQPLVLEGQEAVWSMGDDAPPAFLSRLPRPLWDYCKQRFAQVTNPPIDPLRETHVMSLRVFLGKTAVLNSPLLDVGQMKLLESEYDVRRVSLAFPMADGIEGAKAVLEDLRGDLFGKNHDKPALILLTDRGVDAEHAAIPALLALAVAHKSLVDAGAWGIPLIVESGQVLDTHHVALLVAAGASGVFPYLALEQAVALRPDGVARYRFALEKGLRKVMARMGVSTMASYRNSQLFEVIGLDPALCADVFEDAGCVLGGKTLDGLLQDCVIRHQEAYAVDTKPLQDTGLYRFRQKGERHATSPEIVRRLHRYIKSPTDENFKLYSDLAAEREPVAIRDLLKVRESAPIPVDEVETEASLLSRFSTQAMSLGAISPETHSTLAVAMNRLGGRSNTGEGGEDPARVRAEGRSQQSRQAGGFGPVRCHNRLPRSRRRTRDQDRTRR